MKERIREATSFGRPGIRVRVPSIGGGDGGEDEEEEEEEGGEEDRIWIIALLSFLLRLRKWASNALFFFFLNGLQQNDNLCVV